MKRGPLVAACARPNHHWSGSACWRDPTTSKDIYMNEVGVHYHAPAVGDLTTASVSFSHEGLSYPALFGVTSYTEASGMTLDGTKPYLHVLQSRMDGLMKHSMTTRQTKTPAPLPSLVGSEVPIGRESTELVPATPIAFELVVDFMQIKSFLRSMSVQQSNKQSNPLAMTAGRRSHLRPPQDVQDSTQ
eukprot:1786238-Amphidinium_carterae.2